MAHQTHALAIALTTAAAVATGSACGSAIGEKFSFGIPRPTNAPIAFGATFVGTELDREIIIFNEGRAAFTFVGATTSEGLAAAFSSDEGPIAVEANESMRFAIRFHPTAPGEISGTLTLKLANARPDSVSLQVHGIGLPASCELSSTSLDFGASRVGSASPRQLTLRNPSPLPYQVTLGAFATEGSPTVFAYGAGFAPGEHLVPAASADGTPGELVVPVEFRPDHAGEFRGELRILAPSMCPSSVALFGEGR